MRRLVNVLAAAGIGLGSLLASSSTAYADGCSFTVTSSGPEQASITPSGCGTAQGWYAISVSSTGAPNTWLYAYSSQALADWDWNGGSGCEVECGVCSAPFTCTFDGISGSIVGDLTVNLTGGNFSPVTGSAGSFVAGASSPVTFVAPAAPAVDLLAGADDGIFGGLSDGMHDPIMKGVFPLFIVVTSMGLVLLWVRRAVHA